MKFTIPPTAKEGQKYTVTADETAQFLTIELFAPNGNLVIINQVDNASSISILLKRWRVSLKGICKVRVAAADSGNQEFSAEYDNLVVS